MFRSTKRRMLFVPTIEPRGAVFFYYLSDRSYSLRRYGGPNQPPELLRQDDLPDYTAQQILALAKHDAPAAPHPVEDTQHWWRVTRQFEAAHGINGAGTATTAPTPRSAHQGTAPAPSSGGSGTTCFQSNSGRPVRTLQDWKNEHPPLHWRAGYSAMELARTWLSAGGLPASIQQAATASPLGRLSVDRAVIEHQTSVPGKGRASCTDLMVLASRADRRRVVLAVEGKVDETFGPLVQEWLAQSDGERSHANRLERLHGLCALLRLRPEDCGALRYQLFHRTWSALTTARSWGATDAVLTIHSLCGRGMVGQNGEDFRAFLHALGGQTITKGQPIPLGDWDGVILWGLWVTEPV